MSRITAWINANSDNAPSREAHELEKVVTLFSPLPLLIITTVFGWSIYYFSLQERSWAWIALAALIVLTSVAALAHRRESGDRIVSNSQVKSSNDFTAAQWLPCRYTAHIGEMRPITRKDEVRSNKLCAAMAEQLASIGAYEKTGETRRTIKGKTQEMVRLVELYSVAVNGRGYILIEPFGAEIQLCASVDERLVHRALREAGLKNWEVEQISYDDDVMLFMLRDPKISSGYDLTGAQ